MKLDPFDLLEDADERIESVFPDLSISETEHLRDLILGAKFYILRFEENLEIDNE